MTISAEQVEEANLRGVATKKAFEATISVQYDRQTGKIVITLANGVSIVFAPTLIKGLEGAAAEDFEDAEISPSGLGIHFPKIDADLYVPSLVASKQRPSD
ncbi:MAG: hypothetical protein CTY12_02125 [Methylotenera sp.]|nr:MAG: hypothetical protein CTY12_02125 [Methylotenera sp.]